MTNAAINKYLMKDFANIDLIENKFHYHRGD